MHGSYWSTIGGLPNTTKFPTEPFIESMEWAWMIFSTHIHLVLWCLFPLLQTFLNSSWGIVCLITLSNPSWPRVGDIHMWVYCSQRWALIWRRVLWWGDVSCDEAMCLVMRRCVLWWGDVSWCLASPRKLCWPHKRGPSWYVPSSTSICCHGLSCCYSFI
jgi:hypothetical protein